MGWTWSTDVQVHSYFILPILVWLIGIVSSPFRSKGNRLNNLVKMALALFTVLGCGWIRYYIILLRNITPKVG